MAQKYIDNYKEKGARKRLVDALQKKGIQDAEVLRAIGTVPRHYFFAETFWNQAYKDIAFPIGEGQTISQPYTVAYQTELLHIRKGDRHRFGLPDLRFAGDGRYRLYHRTPGKTLRKNKIRTARKNGL
jgi:hypothetical protein